MTINVSIDSHSYEILIERGVLARAGDYLPFKHGAKLALVSDENVFARYGRILTDSLEARYSVHTHIVPAGENTKCISEFEGALNFFARCGLTRSDAVIALGGGVIGDLAGFAAASWLRGVDFVQIPTTLLSMTDSSIGGKTGINLSSAKNVVGAFHQPKLVLIDPDALGTLPEREYASGMAEVIKHALIRDARLFGELLALSGTITPELIARSIEVKRGVVQRDPRERGERRLLNFGHTLGHAIENALGYGALTHGEGVAIGMVGAARLGESLGITPKGTANTIAKLLTRFSLPCEPPKALSLDAALLLDKKLTGSMLHFIVLNDIGDASQIELPADRAIALLKETNEWML